MKKRILSVLGIVILLDLAFIAFVLLTYPLVGHWVIDKGLPAEARFVGLRPQEIPVGDTTFVVNTGTIDPQKETIVMLHGYSSNRQIWSRFAAHFIDDYNIVAPDLAGHGDSPFVTGLSYSGPSQATRVAALLDALGVDKAHIVGNSMGGFITAHFAMAYPERTLTATLFDPAGITSPEKSDMEKMIDEGRNPFEINSFEQFKEFYAMTMAQPPWLPNIVLAAVAEDFQARKPHLIVIQEDFYQKNWLDGRLADISAPTLVIWGDQDRLLHVSAAPIWAEQVPNAELVILPGIGHMPMFEVPKDAATHYRAFLDRHPSP